MIYKNGYEKRYCEGIFNIENDVLERPWLYGCYKEFKEFRSDTFKVWENVYKPGVNLKDIDIEKVYKGLYPSIDIREESKIFKNFSSSSEQWNKLCGFNLENSKSFGLIEKTVIQVEPEYIYKNWRITESLHDKGSCLGNFVVSHLNNESKLDSLISFTRILGQKDILLEDRINLNKANLDLSYNIEKKEYNIDYLSNLKKEGLSSLIEVIDEPLRVLPETNESYNNLGHDIVLGLEEKERLEGFFDLNNILYEMNILPASSWLINFSFFVIGSIVCGTAVWGFYYILKRTKEYIQMYGVWDSEYNYWEKLLEDKEALITSNKLVKGLHWEWLEVITSS